MTKCNILKMLLVSAECIGEVTNVGYYDTWVTVSIKQADGTECSLNYTIMKEDKKDA